MWCKARPSVVSRRLRVIRAVYTFAARSRRSLFFLSLAVVVSRAGQAAAAAVVVPPSDDRRRIVHYGGVWRRTTAGGRVVARPQPVALFQKRRHERAVLPAVHLLLSGPAGRHVFLLKRTRSVDSTATEETKSSFTKIKSNSALLWRTIRIAVPFYVFVMVLCSLGWLEPQCCDFQNNYKWSLALGLRYLNGPPPT